MSSGLFIVNYCYPGCVPLRNIMRLPKDEAFAFAREMAEHHPATTAFYRFADFERYYPRRLATDRLLRERFIALGGRPVQEHPLSFVLQGSDYLADWFAHGPVTSFPLDRVPAEAVSFTLGDSMAVLEREGALTMLTKDMLLKSFTDCQAPLGTVLAKLTGQYHYIEAQVWDDACLDI